MSTTPKLRQHKGWVYNPHLEAFERALPPSFLYPTAADLIARNPALLTDDDHAPLMDLKANPYEPMPTLEDVVRKWWMKPISQTEDYIMDLCNTLRAAFPDIDTPEGA